jgi:DNA-binding NarL/FixJ family response regulator
VRGVVRTFIETSTPYKVCGEAADGAAAIAKARELSFDLVILDLRMPLRDGVETASALRGMMPNAKILGFTMYSGDLANRVLEATGFDAVVAKQDGLTKLVETIDALMPRHPR